VAELCVENIYKGPYTMQSAHNTSVSTEILLQLNILQEIQTTNKK